MKRLIFLRHGQSEYNLFHRFTGWDDCALTPAGKEQARQAGVLLRQAGKLPQRAYVSKLVRARQTLQNALQTAGWQISATPAWQLNERHYGAVQGLTRAEAGRQFGPEQVLLWRRTFTACPVPRADNSAAQALVPAGITAPNGESLQMAQARALAFFRQEIFPAFAQADMILVAAHEDLLRALACYFKQLPPAAVETLVVPPATPWIMELDENFHAQKDYFLGDPIKIAAFLKRRPE